MACCPTLGEDQLFAQIDTGISQQPSDRAFRHMGGIVFDSERALLLVKGNMPDTVRALAAWGNLVVGGGRRHFGHHGVPQFGERRGTSLLCADFYLRSRSR